MPPTPAPSMIPVEAPTGQPTSSPTERPSSPSGNAIFDATRALVDDITALVCLTTNLSCHSTRCHNLTCVIALALAIYFILRLPTRYKMQLQAILQGNQHANPLDNLRVNPQPNPRGNPPGSRPLTHQWPLRTKSISGSQ